MHDYLASYGLLTSAILSLFVYSSQCKHALGTYAHVKIIFLTNTFALLRIILTIQVQSENNTSISRVTFEMEDEAFLARCTLSSCNFQYKEELLKILQAMTCPLEYNSLLGEK